MGDPERIYPHDSPCSQTSLMHCMLRASGHLARGAADRRRSRCTCSARGVVLPRPRDPVADWQDLFDEAVEMGLSTEGGAKCEHVNQTEEL